MPTPTATRAPRLRVFKRPAVRDLHPKPQTFSRPSLLDWQLRGDISVMRRGPKLYCLCANNYPLAYLAATRLDVASLNQLAWNLRHRWPRPGY